MDIGLDGSKYPRPSSIPRDSSPSLLSNNVVTVTDTWASWGTDESGHFPGHDGVCGTQSQYPLVGTQKTVSPSVTETEGPDINESPQELVHPDLFPLRSQSDVPHIPFTRWASLNGRSPLSHRRPSGSTRHDTHSVTTLSGAGTFVPRVHNGGAGTPETRPQGFSRSSTSSCRSDTRLDRTSAGRQI